jgi:hypothetical protein
LPEIGDLFQQFDFVTKMKTLIGVMQGTEQLIDLSGRLGTVQSTVLDERQLSGDNFGAVTVRSWPISACDLPDRIDRELSTPSGRIRPSAFRQLTFAIPHPPKVAGGH